MRRLLERGASIDIDLDVTDKRGETVLHHAARRSHAEMVQLLLDNSAHVLRQNEYGRTVPDIVRQRGWKYGVKVLTAHMVKRNIVEPPRPVPLVVSKTKTKKEPLPPIRTKTRKKRSRYHRCEPLLFNFWEHTYVPTCHTSRMKGSNIIILVSFLDSESINWCWNLYFRNINVFLAI